MKPLLAILVEGTADKVLELYRPRLTNCLDILEFLPNVPRPEGKSHLADFGAKIFSFSRLEGQPCRLTLASHKNIISFKDHYILCFIYSSF